VVILKQLQAQKFETAQEKMRRRQGFLLNSKGIRFGAAAGEASNAMISFGYHLDLH
jgi:hypothetical protein